MGVKSVLYLYIYLYDLRGVAQTNPDNASFS
jgi:hypothetical protein